MKLKIDLNFIWQWIYVMNSENNYATEFNCTCFSLVSEHKWLEFGFSNKNDEHKICEQIKVEMKQKYNNKVFGHCHNCWSACGHHVTSDLLFPKMRLQQRRGDHLICWHSATTTITDTFVRWTIFCSKSLVDTMIKSNSPKPEPSMQTAERERKWKESTVWEKTTNYD